jgi:hypothetical protein
MYNVERPICIAVAAFATVISSGSAIVFLRAGVLAGSRMVRPERLAIGHDRPGTPLT